jgi:hypothetical protein
MIHKISRNMRKLSHTPTLIIIIKKYYDGVQEYNTGYCFLKCFLFRKILK